MTDKIDWITGQVRRTREAHEEARARYLASHGREARRTAAAEREANTPAGLNHTATRGHRLGRCSCKAAAA